MKEKILKLFNDREELPLYYIESGSRLWSMASEDSDYDIRGIHILSKRQYFDFRKQQNVIDYTEYQFDFVSFELDKAFGLLAKSNPNVLEWIRADTIYLNRLPDWDHFRRQVIDNIEYKALYHSYLSMAQNNIKLLEKGKKFTFKIVLYCIRALLSADLASRHRLPKLNFEDLLKQVGSKKDIIVLGNSILAKKLSATEKQKVNPNERNKTLETLHIYQHELEGRDVQLLGNKDQLIKALKEFSYKIKAEVYS